MSDEEFETMAERIGRHFDRVRARLAFEQSDSVDESE